MKKRLSILLCAIFIGGLMFGVGFGVGTPDMASASATIPGTNYLVSQSASNAYANAASNTPYVSGNGEYVAFDSNATNLASITNSGYPNVFVKNTSTGAVTLASIKPNGSQFSDPSTVRGISYSGTYVLFSVDVAGAYGDGLLYVYNLSTNTSTEVPANTIYDYGSAGGAISGDGRYILSQYLTYPGSNWDVILTDMSTGVNKTISTGGNSYANGIGGISCDGNVMSFGGYLATIDESGNVDLTDPGTNGPVSCDGNTALYITGGGSLTGIGEYSRLTGQSTLIYSIRDTGDEVEGEGISGDGRYVAFTTNDSVTTTPSYSSTGAGSYADTYLYDVKSGTMQLVSFTVAGNRSGNVYRGGVSISGDASTIAYDYLTPSSTNTSEELISGLTTGASSAQDDIYTSQTGL